MPRGSAITDDDLHFIQAPCLGIAGGLHSNLSFGTMDINARGISGSDPGAVPGGSTKEPFVGGIAGPNQDRRTCKGVALSR